MRPVLLDLFCGAGMAADGYVAAGFEVVGVDIEPQPDYPYRFMQCDALEVLAGAYLDPRDYAAVHASPPCQALTRAGRLRDAQGGESRYPDLLTPTLALLRSRWAGRPWVCENVEGARSLMPEAVRLCGSAFGLEVQRHRLFLASVPLVGTTCQHQRFPADPVSGRPRPWGVYHVPGDSIPAGGRTVRDAEHGRAAMGVGRPLPWASLKEGFPPAYTEYVGRQVAEALR